MTPKALQDRLLPMCLPRQDDVVVKVRKRFLPKVICLPDLSRMPPPRGKTDKGAVDDIVRGVLTKYDLPPSALKGKGRVGNHYLARQELSYLLALNTDISVCAIGRIMNKDHTTIIHAVAKFCETYGLPIPRGAKWRKRKSGS